MKANTARRITLAAAATAVVLLALVAVGCESRPDAEQHDHTSGECGGHDRDHAAEAGHAGDSHEAHGRADEPGHDALEADDHEGHDHGVEADHADDDHVEEPAHDAHDADGHEGHDHDDHADGVMLTLSERDRRDAGIELATAGPGRLESSARLLGEVRVNEERLAHVVPPVPGVVREVEARVGDDVRAGELLAILASRELAEARSQYLAARGRRELAEIAHEREQALWERGLLAEQDHLDAKQALLEADIEFQAAEQTLHALGVTDEELAVLTGGHEAGALTRYELRAPISGTVIELHMVLGETVGEDSDVLTIADLSTVWVDFDVPQTDLASVREGQAITISASGVDIPEATAVVDFVSPVVDAETRTALARVEIPNASGRWRPGLFVTATSIADEFEAPVVVPKRAVQTIEGETVLFVPDGAAFESAPVVLGRSNGTHVEIESGLAAGEQYVLEGAFALKAEVVTSGLDAHAGHGH
jgi:cobalt-zinc-cadmium efflux system membrane fusion protein